MATYDNVSTQNPSYGAKVTTEPAPAKAENAGPVAADSLAAESTSHSGVFSNNRGAAPQSVAGGSSTFTNTSTSGATALPPASSASSRPGANSDAYSSQSKAHAVEYSTGPSSASTDSQNADPAPTYLHNQYMRDTKGPHGKNLTEGGFESDEARNASWNGEVGTENDPGRVAEKTFQREAAESGNDAGHPRDRQEVGKGAGLFGALGGDVQA